MARRPGPLALIAGLALVVAFSALDAVWGDEAIITVAVLLGPIVTSLLAPARDVAVVAVAATVAALLSGTWNDNFGETAYWLRTGVVLAGAVAAMSGAGQRERAEEGRRRFALLAALAELGQGTAALDETIEAVTDALVPAFADVCLVDLVRDGEPARLAVRASGPDAPALEAWLRSRPPSGADVEISSRAATRSLRARVVPRIDAAALESWAHDDEDARLMRQLAPRSSMTVPLLARGRTLGSLSLTVRERSGRSYAAADGRFGEVLAGRVALALDNAGLSMELETAEAQLSASLERLADAVLIEAPDGRLVHANPAAAELLGFTSARELLGGASEAALAGLELSTEDLRPLGAAELLASHELFAGELPAPRLVRHVDRRTGAAGWSVVKTTPVPDRAGRPRLAVHVLEDVTAIKRTELGQRLLVRASRILTSSLDIDRTLQEITELVVPELADWCTISLPDGTGHLRQAAVAHVEPDRVRFARELDERHPPRLDGGSNPAGVMRDGGSRCVNGITSEQLRRSAEDDEHHRLLLELGLSSALAVPLVATGEPLGVLTLATAESRRSFSEADVLLAEQLGRQIGTAVHTGRLYQERSAIAATLQAGLLPPELPALPGWTAAPFYRPAGTESWVGGDFYDAFPVRGGWMVVVGDVAGRGAPAATLTALARHTLRTAGRLLDDPADALRELNQELYARGGEALCTLVCVLLPGDPEAREVAVTCAGHPQPVLLRDGAATQVGRFGTIIGAFADATWAFERVAIAPGDTLVLYTDGVLDTVGAGGRFGERRLLDALTGAATPAEVVERIDRALTGFQRGPQADDTAALALGRAPAPGPIALPRGAEAPGLARRAVRERLGRTLGQEQLEHADLLVSELVTNAVRHGKGAIELRIGPVDGTVRIEVADEGHGFVTELRERGPDDYGGRGLWLVARLAERWGVREGSSRVWFELGAGLAGAPD